MCIYTTASAILRSPTNKNVTSTATPTPRRDLQNFNVLRPVGRSSVIAGVPLPVRQAHPVVDLLPRKPPGACLPHPSRNNNGAIRTPIPAGWLSPTAAPVIVGDVEDTQRDPEDNVATANSPPAILLSIVVALNPTISGCLAVSVVVTLRQPPIATIIVMAATVIVVVFALVRS